MISNRISKISSNKEIFDQSAPYYNQVLKSSGYKEKITYSSNPNDKKRTRKRQIIWFNPPFSMNASQIWLASFPPQQKDFVRNRKIKQRKKNL